MRVRNSPFPSAQPPHESSHGPVRPPQQGAWQAPPEPVRPAPGQGWQEQSQGGWQPGPGVEPGRPAPQQWQPPGPAADPRWQAQEIPNSGPSLVGAGMGLAGSMGFNEALAGAALNQVTSQMQASGLTGWFPTVFLSLQQLFNVGHSYVLRKLLLLMCPFLRKGQGSPSPWSPNGAGDGSQHGVGADGLKADVEDPDLYIPLMSYVTYVLLCGMYRGILQDFRPEVLPKTATYAIVFLVIEVGLSKMGFYIAGSGMPVLSLAANSGYKYVLVMMMVLSRILVGTNPVYWLLFAYFGACAAWSTRRFLLHMEPSEVQQQYGVAPTPLHKHLVLAVSVAQIPICWLLTPSTRI